MTLVGYDSWGNITIINKEKRYDYSGLEPWNIEIVKTLIRQKRFGECWNYLKQFSDRRGQNHATRIK